MGDVAIRVEGLGKQYRIGRRQEEYRTLRDALADAAMVPVRALQAIVRRKGNRRNTFEVFWALRDVSFEVQRGEVLGIIGRNGAGKSTLLKILSRITEPAEGYAEVHGRVGSLLEVGTGFHQELSGRENIFLNGAILGMKRAEIKRKFDEIVAFSEVEKFIDTPVKHYSTGMYLRLAFSVAAHLDPEILLVDEVLAVGDATFQKKCMGKMGDVARLGRTVLFVSHNLGAIANLCQSAILLSEGRKIGEGSSRAVISQYVQIGTRQSGEVRWGDQSTAPGNENVRLHSVRIVSDGEVTSDVSIEKPVLIEFEFWNFRRDAELCTSIHLLDKMGVQVLSSANFPSASVTRDEWFGKPYPVGMFRATCSVPGNFLNEGLYAVNVLVLSQVNRIELFAREVIGFTVHDTGAMRAEWGGGWIGVVRPRLAWKTEYVGDS